MLVLNGCRVYDAELVDRERNARPSAAAAVIGADCCPSLGAAVGDDLNDGCERASAGCVQAPAPPPSHAGAAASGDDASVDGTDLCPDNPSKVAPGICGCQATESDRDRDGTVDCIDGCPDDRLKTAPGLCGCGERELDTDDDGSADCVDGCPRDAAKTAHGACGCGHSDTDRDDDTIPDCVDRCPSDANKSAPGACGCGTPEPTDPTKTEVQCAKSALAHRYSFEGEGSRLLDTVAGADAWVPDGASAKQTEGRLELSGDLGERYAGEGYAQLPAAVWQGLNSATFEVWVIWLGSGRRGGAEWQRIFDFGTPEGSGRTQSYLYLTTRGEGGIQVAFSLDHRARGEASVITTPSPAERNVVQHIAVVVDHDAQTLALYYEGEVQGTAPLESKLEELDPANLWLGRSNFGNDPGLNGSLLEFRIYNRALTAAQLRASAAAGPDYVYQ